MRIAHIAAELAPIAKVGGLGDVILGLSRALVDKKKDVEIILPKYDCLDLTPIDNLKVILHDLSVSFAGEMHHNTIWEGRVEGVRTTLIDDQDPAGFFARKKVYGCKDDPSRFAYFCAAAVEYLVSKDQMPDIVHLHDWHAAILALLLHHRFEKRARPKVLLTIHNLSYQGICSKTLLSMAGLPLSYFQEICDGEAINLLKSGIIYSDFITTVSPNYAKEILSPEQTGTLNKTLRECKEKFLGILNGIDYHYWNPATDPFLPPLSPSESAAQKKKKLQSYLRKALSLADKERPIVSAITRLVPQKGPELIKQALYHTLEKKGQFVLLGSAFDEKIHEEFSALKRTLAANKDVHIELTYNEPLSHLVYAASDLFLVPSRFEPCGLTPMIAMHYGTVPLVRLTGGLVDIINEGQNGFTFDKLTAEDLNATLDRAIDCWYNQPTVWQQIKERGMEQDFSWDGPAEEYLKIYRSLSGSDQPSFLSLKGESRNRG